MLNLHMKFVPWIILIQKPPGNIRTDVVNKTISTNFDDRHDPQCINQTNELINANFSKPVNFIVIRDPHHQKMIQSIIIQIHP